MPTYIISSSDSRAGVSADLATWTTTNTGVSGRCPFQIVSNGSYFVRFNLGQGPICDVTVDGVTWADSSLLNDTLVVVNQAAWGNGTWVASFSTTGPGVNSTPRYPYNLAVSTDGLAWTTQTVPDSNPITSSRMIAWDGTVWISSEVSGTTSTRNQVQISTDLNTWTTKTLPWTATNGGIAVAAADNIIWAVSTDSSRMAISTDHAVSWTAHTPIPILRSANWRTLTAGLNRYLVRANVGWLVSVDGINWSTLPNPLDLTSIVFSPELKEFIGVDFTGKIVASSNLADWTVASSAATTITQTAQPVGIASSLGGV